LLELVKHLEAHCDAAGLDGNARLIGTIVPGQDLLD